MLKINLATYLNRIRKNHVKLIFYKNFKLLRKFSIIEKFYSREARQILTSLMRLAMTLTQTFNTYLKLVQVKTIKFEVYI